MSGYEKVVELLMEDWWWRHGLGTWLRQDTEISGAVLKKLVILIGES